MRDLEEKKKVNEEFLSRKKEQAKVRETIESFQKRKMELK